MKPERKMWEDLNKKFKLLRIFRWFKFDRIENKLNTGMPDVTYSWENPATGKSAHGWIELKVIKPPENPTKLFKINHFTELQRHFIISRGKMAGYCWLLVQVDRNYLLYNHIAVECVGRVSFEVMEKMATCKFHAFGSFARLKQQLETNYKDIL